MKIIKLRIAVTEILTKIMTIFIFSKNVILLQKNMRVHVLLLCFFALSFFSCKNNTKQTKETNKKEKPYREIVYQYDTLRIACDNLIFQSVNILAHRFMSEYQNIVIQIISSDSSYAFLHKFDFVITSHQSSEDNKYPIACDVLTLIVNFHHSNLQHLAMYGIKIETLSHILQGKINNWKQVDKNLDPAPLKFYLFPYKNGGYQQIIKLFQLKEQQIQIIPELREKDIFTNVKNVQTGIGFCSHTEAYDLSTKFRKTGIYIVGIDLNNSEFLENEELFWDDIEMLKDAYSKKQIPENLIRAFYIYTSSDISQTAKKFLQFAQQHAPSIFEQQGFLKPLK